MSPLQRTILADAVIDPDEWYDNAVTVLGKERADAALAEKVTRRQPEYNAAVKQPGYQPRAERQAVIDQARADAVKENASQAEAEKKKQQIAVLDAILSDADSLAKLKSAIK